jgi:fatty-acyl-CoA synthase
VLEAAVIGVSHPKWGERPLLVVVKREGASVTREDLLRFYDGKTANWCRPDDVVFVEDLPHTATGKVSKKTLREKFSDHRLPTV